MSSDRYAPGAIDEFALMAAAAQQAFEAKGTILEFSCGCVADDDPCPSWHKRLHGSVGEEFLGDTPIWMQHERTMHLIGSMLPSVHILSASTSNPPERTNTADTYRMFAQVADVEPGDRVLVVTTQVFVPFQTFDAIRMLLVPRRVNLDVVGFGTERGDRPDTPEYLLQELLSAVRSARRLALSLLP
jgi:hypothetical protein